MNFIAQETAQKLRGGFYTQPEIASFLAQWVLEKHPRTLLEPSCGAGAFLQAVHQFKMAAAPRIFACEINTAEAAKARAAVPDSVPGAVRVHSGDFLKWFLGRRQNEPSFDAVLGNPPFIRYQYFEREQQRLAERVITQFGLPFTKHTNAWVPFVVASVALLAPGGRLAMVIPSEIFHIPHAEAARRFLASSCDRVLLLDPSELWFEEVLQGVVLLLAEKSGETLDSRRGISVLPIRKPEILREAPAGYFQTAEFSEPPEGKWMPILLSKRERSLLDGIKVDDHFARFDRLAKVDVGIVTGANKFFLVTDAVIKEFGLQPWAHPMIGRSEHVSGVIYDWPDHHENRAAGVPTNFLWFDDADPSTYPAKALAYLRSGEEQGLPARYKCRIRSPWFRVPSVSATPVSMLKRAHHFPRLILNQARVFTTDTAYRIQPIHVSADELVSSFINSVTALSAELEGRHYGGGVLELVPSEIERLLMPVLSKGQTNLQLLDQRVRTCSEPREILHFQDHALLTPAGLTKQDQELVFLAADRLRQRRQRTVTEIHSSPELG